MYFPREIQEKRRENEKEQAMQDMEAVNIIIFFSFYDLATQKIYAWN